MASHSTSSPSSLAAGAAGGGPAEASAETGASSSVGGVGFGFYALALSSAGELALLFLALAILATTGFYPYNGSALAILAREPYTGGKVLSSGYISGSAAILLACALSPFVNGLEVKSSALLSYPDIVSILALPLTSFGSTSLTPSTLSAFSSSWFSPASSPSL